MNKQACTNPLHLKEWHLGCCLLLGHFFFCNKLRWGRREHCSPLLEVVLQVRIFRVWSRHVLLCTGSAGACPCPQWLGRLTILTTSPQGVGYQSSAVIQPFPQPPLGWRRSALQSSHNRDTARQLYTFMCSEWRKPKQNQHHSLENKFMTWLPAGTIFSISFLFYKHFYIFPIHFTKTSLIFSVTVLHALCLVPSVLNNLCFVHNSMWLSLIPGSNVPVWVSPMVSKRKKDAWCSVEIYLQCSWGHAFLSWPEVLAWLLSWPIPLQESLFDWWSEQLICSSASVCTG